MQPFMRLFNLPPGTRAPLPRVIHQSYITHDCFHFSQKGHALGKITIVKFIPEKSDAVYISHADNESSFQSLGFLVNAFVSR
jgi:hypothetical protein